MNEHINMDNLTFSQRIQLKYRMAKLIRQARKMKKEFYANAIEYDDYKANLIQAIKELSLIFIVENDSGQPYTDEDFFNMEIEELEQMVELGLEEIKKII